MTVYALFNRRVTIFGIPENIGVRSFFFLGKSRVSHPEFVAVNMPTVKSTIGKTSNIMCMEAPTKNRNLFCGAESKPG